MIWRGLCVLAMLSNCVPSSPLTQSQQENEDVKVMRCIVEALADVLSGPRPLPVSQDCLLTLSSDDRLVSILRHHSFLKELQEIALRGEEGAQQDGGEDAPGGATPASEAVGDVPDRSMLEALGSPAERSILSAQTKAGNGDAGEDESREGGQSRQDGEEKRESEEKPGSPPSAHSEEESSERKDEKRRAEKEHEEEPNEDLIQDNKGGGSGEKRSAHRSKEEDKEKRAAQASLKHQEKHQDESHQRWTKTGQSTAVKHEAPHHSKEVSEEEEREERPTQASPEQKQLQMIARRRHEEKRGSGEEGSASRKSEDQEVESLAAIESELESAARKLHELRRG